MQTVRVYQRDREMEAEEVYIGSLLNLHMVVLRISRDSDTLEQVFES